MCTEVLEKVLSYVDTHIYEKISLAELADIAGYSPFYFSKLFTETMGISVTTYIRIRKLQYAACSLLEGKRVLDVSLMYAFESHEGFTRSFTKFFGSTPSKVKKNLASYRVPEYVLPKTKERREDMAIDRSVYQLVFEVLKTSFEEADVGYCTEIHIALLPNGKIRIFDNGRGIPLSENKEANKRVLEKIFAGHPISHLEYASMEDFNQCNMQTVNSLCESLQVNVYRDEKWFQQDYVRGIAQHEISCIESNHATGTEIVFKPDTAIFGDATFSVEIIKNWVEKQKPAALICFS